MNKLEEEIQNDQELFSYFRDRNTTLCQDNFNFLMEHPEVKRLLNDYLSNILLHKPDDVFKFTKDYFKFLCDKGESHKLVVLVGPNSVGKTTMIDYIIKEFPNDFMKPVFRSTVKKENGYKLMDIEEHSNGLKNNLFIYDRFDTEKKEYISLEKSEIEKIQKEGKIAILEIDLEGAKKMNNLDIEANFIGILPPSLDALRQRIKANTKLNTEKINAELEKASDEIKEIEKYTFFMFRIINDELEAGLKDTKNAMISLYPKLKYSDEMIEEIKNMSHEVQQNEENNVANNENKIKEDSKDEIKEKEEEKSVESERENK
jgi:guanylate kinase